MQPKLSENIKKYRKEMNLTQEGLAEALGVTIGAVSKWENGNNVPDIVTMMEIANFFNISMDELVGYDMSSKKVEDICKRIKDLYYDLNFDDAIVEVNNALVRYPHNFKIIYTCANMYFFKSLESKDVNDRNTAVDLFTRAMLYISQNNDPDISEYSIKFKIASIYGEIDREKSLELLKEINYDGCNNIHIALNLFHMNKRDEAIQYFNSALLKNFADQYVILTNFAIAIASSGKKSDIKKAIEFIDGENAILDIYGNPDKINYTHKQKAINYIIKAWWLSCLGDIDDMEKYVQKAYELAIMCDKQKSINNISNDLRFFISDKIAHVFDEMGAGTVEGIEQMFQPDGNEIPYQKNIKYLQNVIDYWNQLKK